MATDHDHCRYLSDGNLNFIESCQPTEPLQCRLDLLRVVEKDLHQRNFVKVFSFSISLLSTGNEKSVKNAVLSNEAVY